MLIARTPLHINLAGAGTGFPAYARRYGGVAVNVTIDRYAYTMVSQTDSPTVNIATSDYERLLDGNEPTPGDGFLLPAQAILKAFGIDRGLSIFMTPELPPFTGVGAITGSMVALAWALGRLEHRPLSAADAARLAHSAEVTRLRLPCGGADTYGQAIGGLTAAEINGDDVWVSPIRASESAMHALQTRLMLFFTGRIQRDTRGVEDVARAAERNRAGVIDALHEIKAAATDLRNVLIRGEVGAIGDCLNRTWQATRHLGPEITDPWIDQWYEMALNAGASGGKVNGLGAGSFLVLYCEPGRQQRVTEDLESAGLRRIAISLETSGVDLLLDESAVMRTSNEVRSSRGNTRH
jgi:D-glycero-alpha-D-manno-heptose-7-phosphate kinase